MIETNTIGKKLTQFISILFPILITQLALFLMTFLDTTMSGHVSKNDLAGVAIGSSLWIPISTGLSGILLGITPIIAQLIGAKKGDKVSYTVIQGIYISILISVFIIFIGALSIEPILSSLHLDPEVYDIAYNYLIALSFGIIPLFVYYVLRSFIDALGKTRVTMFITLSSLPVNSVLNYLFILGSFGFPKLGGVGAGIATAITYWCTIAITVYFVIRKQPFLGYHIFKTFFKPSLRAWKEILKIGIPIGFAIFFETSIFSAVTILMSQFDTVTIAAHQIAMNFASLVYMLPLSISMALTIVVGFEVGANRIKDAKQYGILGLTFALLLSLLSALIIYYGRESIASIYSKDAEVILLAQQFLIYAIFFQISDALATPIQGVLRGYKDVNLTLIVALVSYWGIGLPLGYVLGNFTDLGAFGYWVGLIIGLAIAAIGLSFRLHTIQRRQQRIIKKSA